MVSKLNFLAKACKIWNFFISGVLTQNDVNEKTGYIIPGEKANSDISASIFVVKESLVKLLLNLQSKGSSEMWEDGQFDISVYKSV